MSEREEDLINYLQKKLKVIFGGGGVGSGRSYGVYKCYRSPSGIERKFFVFVGGLEKGDSDAL